MLDEFKLFYFVGYFTTLSMPKLYAVDEWIVKVRWEVVVA
jgi:hypothetical protein